MYSRVLKATALLLTVSTISACSTIGSFFPKPPVEVKVVTKQVERQITQPVMPRAIELRSPGWVVITKDNLDEIEALIEKEGMAFFAMSVDDYEIMAANMQEIRRYINQLKEVVVYYREVTKPQKPAEEEPESNK